MVVVVHPALTVVVVAHSAQTVLGVVHSANKSEDNSPFQGTPEFAYCPG